MCRLVIFLVAAWFSVAFSFSSFLGVSCLVLCSMRGGHFSIFYCCKRIDLCFLFVFFVLSWGFLLRTMGEAAIFYLYLYSVY